MEPSAGDRDQVQEDEGGEPMAQVGIVMGSDSDMPVMAKAADILEELGISYEMKIISAHREPDVFFEYAKSAEEKGFKVIIAGAGMALRKAFRRRMHTFRKWAIRITANKQIKTMREPGWRYLTGFV